MLERISTIAESDSRIGVLGPAFLDGKRRTKLLHGWEPSYAIPSMKSKSDEPVDVEWGEGSF